MSAALSMNLLVNTCNLFVVFVLFQCQWIVCCIGCSSRRTKSVGLPEIKNKQKSENSPICFFSFVFFVFKIITINPCALHVMYRRYALGVCACIHTELCTKKKQPKNKSAETQRTKSEQKNKTVSHSITHSR